MTGDQLLIAHRRAGNPIRDGRVYIDADGGRASSEWQRYGEHACVSIPPSDYLPTLDLRFCVGLVASVEGENPERVQAIAEAAAKHAKRVIAVTFERGRALVESINDTEGVMNWHK